MINSLRARLLAATAALLLAFLGLTGAAVQTAVQKRAEQAEHDRLQGLAYALLSSAEINAQGEFNLAPRVLPESGLTRPHSGLYAMVLNEDGQVVWHSPSLLNPIDIAKPPQVGQWKMMRIAHGKDNELIALSYGFRWVTHSGKSYRFTLVMAASTASLTKQMQRFQGVLWTVLLVSALILLIVELLILRWGLSPLRRLARNLANLENDGERRLEGEYPNEIQPLVSNLNTMLGNDQARLKRYRNALGDLAHSLKTPMAILRGIAEDHALPDQQRAALQSQLRRMNEILDYQLQKAATAGKRSLTRQLTIAPLVKRMGRALTKVYAEPGVYFDIRVDEKLRAPIDEGDLTELLGTLMDNAAKYGHDRVVVDAFRQNSTFYIRIDDNGPGFGDHPPSRLLERGVRSDTTREGQGLGLSVAAEIVHSYNGDIALAESDMGGGRIIVSIPDS